MPKINLVTGTREYSVSQSLHDILCNMFAEHNAKYRSSVSVNIAYTKNIAHTEGCDLGVRTLFSSQYTKTIQNKILVTLGIHTPRRIGVSKNLSIFQTFRQVYYDMLKNEYDAVYYKPDIGARSYLTFRFTKADIKVLLNAGLIDIPKESKKSDDTTDPQKTDNGVDSVVESIITEAYKTNDKDNRYICSKERLSKIYCAPVERDGIKPYVAIDTLFECRVYAFYVDNIYTHDPIIVVYMRHKGYDKHYDTFKHSEFIVLNGTEEYTTSSDFDSCAETLQHAIVAASHKNEGMRIGDNVSFENAKSVLKNLYTIGRKLLDHTHSLFIGFDAYGVEERIDEEVKITTGVFEFQSEFCDDSYSADNMVIMYDLFKKTILSYTKDLLNEQENE